MFSLLLDLFIGLTCNFKVGGEGKKDTLYMA